MRLVAVATFDEFRRGHAELRFHTLNIESVAVTTAVVEAMGLAVAVATAAATVMALAVAAIVAVVAATAVGCYPVTTQAKKLTKL